MTTFLFWNMSQSSRIDLLSALVLVLAECAVDDSVIVEAVGEAGGQLERRSTECERIKIFTSEGIESPIEGAFESSRITVRRLVTAFGHDVLLV